METHVNVSTCRPLYPSVHAEEVSGASIRSSRRRRRTHRRARFHDDETVRKRLFSTHISHFHALNNRGIERDDSTFSTFFTRAWGKEASTDSPVMIATPKPHQTPRRRRPVRAGAFPSQSPGQLRSRPVYRRRLQSVPYASPRVVVVEPP